MFAIGAAALAVTGAGAILLPAAPALGQWTYRQYRDPERSQDQSRYESGLATLLRLRDDLSSQDCDVGQGCSR